ncbi:MAG: hypothetical protein ACRDBO_20105 [Lachnospiraceae bacterium]
MRPEIIIALIGLAGSVTGSFAGILVSAKLTTYRLEQLEKKVDKHNTVIERTFILEEQMKVANHRIKDLEEK